MANERAHADYRAWLLRQLCRCQPCINPVVIHHHTAGETEPHAKSLGGRRGKGQRASDTEGMPLCNRHHRQLHDLSGFFGDYAKRDLRTWQDDQVRELRNTWAMQEPQPAVPEPGRPISRRRVGAGWTVATVLSWLHREAPTRPAPVAAALNELAELIEGDTF